MTSGELLNKLLYEDYEVKLKVVISKGHNWYHEISRYDAIDVIKWWKNDVVVNAKIEGNIIYIG